MAQEEQDVKETKSPSSSSNRPFDIENLFAPDKSTKKQKTFSELRTTDPYRPNFTVLGPTALSTNGDYSFFFLNVVLNVDDLFFSGKFMNAFILAIRAKIFVPH